MIGFRSDVVSHVDVASTRATCREGCGYDYNSEGVGRVWKAGVMTQSWTNLQLLKDSAQRRESESHGYGKVEELGMQKVRGMRDAEKNADASNDANFLWMLVNLTAIPNVSATYGGMSRVL